MDSQSRFVAVPVAPGGQLEPVARVREPDEVDGLVEEMLGEDTTDGPGVADLVLFTAGFCVVVWGVLSSSSTLVGVGAIAGLLGVVLPLRSLGRRVRDRRALAAIESARMAAGVLDVASPEVAALVAAYERLDAGSAGSVDGSDARAAGWVALGEVATMLAGRRPAGPAEVEYVAARTTALGRLAEALEAQLNVDETRVTIEARNELDALAGTGSLLQVDEILRRHGSS